MKENGQVGDLEEGPVEVRRKRGNSLDGSIASEDPPGCCDGGIRGCLLRNLMLIFLVIGIVAGVVMGILIRMYHPSWSDQDDQEAKRKRMYLGFLGVLFIRMLKCMIIPLIVSSLISAMAGLPGRARGRIGGFTVLYYMITTFIAVIIGIILVSTIKPGIYAKKTGEVKERIAIPSDFILDLVRNIFPNNIIAATSIQTYTEYETHKELQNITDPIFGNMTEELVTVIDDFNPTTKAGTNVLGLVVFSIVLGLIVGTLEEKAVVFKEAVDGFMRAIIEMVRLIIWFAPIGICFLLAERIVRMEDPASEFAALGVYMGTVTAGLLIHALIVLPAVYLIFSRKNPFKFAAHMSQALLTALGTASSSATLPITLRCVTINAGVDKRIGYFVLPLGATINMDGTALYEAVASIFIAQVNNIWLDVGQTITVAITATAAAIGAAGVPEAGLVTMTIVLTAVGLPVEDVALILAVDWLLDRFRTTVNVWGDSIGCGVVEGLSQKQLRKLDAEDHEIEMERQRQLGEEEDEAAGYRKSGFGHHNPSYMADPTEIRTDL